LAIPKVQNAINNNHHICVGGRINVNGNGKTDWDPHGVVVASGRIARPSSARSPIAIGNCRSEWRFRMLGENRSEKTVEVG
jgi:hypothetical protein